MDRLATGEPLFNMQFHDEDVKEMPLEGDEIDDDDYLPSKRSIKELLAAAPIDDSKPAKPGDPSFPWPSHETFLTDLLFSSSCLRFSDAQKRAILTWGKGMGAANVPSLYSLSKIQKLIRDQVGDPTKKVQSMSGAIFHINDIAHALALALDYSNRLTHEQMEDYPSVLGKLMSEVSHGSKIFDIPEHLTTPTA
ncbi:hypothetical protein FRB94_014433 [Tulasnella sp. JGI-2019a]|nr:hypothetical protein FRB93_011350 [Tulasnella sp. JGI-2019a]KAG8989395.1 hypothetical protein FRB94_014433 [Tulasnella sp. JGI-2019a]